MFLESLVETPAVARAQRGWTTLVSLTLQTSAVLALLAVNLFYPHSLPTLTFAEGVMNPPVGAGPRELEDEPHVNVVSVQTEFVDGQIRAPGRIPNGIYTPATQEALPTGSGVGPYVPWAVPDTVGERTTITKLMDNVGYIQPTLVPPKQLRHRVSEGVIEGLLVQRTQPEYPVMAVRGRIEGDVLLAAVISRTGSIEQLRVLSGHPMLVRAAMNAVQQWRYRPYMLNSEPVEVETQVTVKFRLSR